MTKKKSTNIGNTKVNQILKERWSGKDMETYFEERSKELLAELQLIAVSDKLKV